MKIRERGRSVDSDVTPDGRILDVGELRLDGEGALETSHGFSSKRKGELSL